MDWLKLASKIVAVIPMVVNLVENLVTDKKGKDKQDAAVEGLSDFIEGIEATAGKELMDNEEFQILIRKLIDDYVAVMNFVKKTKINIE